VNEPGQPWQYENPYKAPAAIVAPEPQVHADYRASRGTRLAARIVDNVMFGLTAVPPAVVAITLNESDLVVLWACASALPAFLFLVFQSYLVTTTGQSLAKRWFGLRIVRADGRPVGFALGVVVREWLVLLIGCVPLLGMFFRLADSLFILGEERRCVHDLIAGTVVVRA
jgi:uncharacterized RDD family membrane protein YckC